MLETWNFLVLAAHHHHPEREREREREMATGTEVVSAHGHGCCKKGPGYASPLEAMSGPRESLIYVTCVYAGNCCCC